MQLKTIYKRTNNKTIKVNSDKQSKQAINNVIVDTLQSLQAVPRADSQNVGSNVEQFIASSETLRPLGIANL